MSILEKDENGLTLKLKIRPRLIERLFYFAVIITLAIFVIMGTFCDSTSCKITEEETTTETEQETAGAVTVETEEEETAAVVEEVEEEEVVEVEVVEVEEEEEEEVVEYSGKVGLTINEVMTEVKNEGTYGKVTGVRFTINNEKEDFMPAVEVYTYEDGDTSSVFATKPREERIYSTLKFPNSNSYELSIASQQFTDLTEDIICKVIIKDKSTDEEVVTETQKFKIT